MAKIKLTQQDLQGGMRGVSQKYTGDTGNVYSILRANNLSEYDIPQPDTEIIIPDNIYNNSANTPNLDPYAEALADSLPKNKISVDGIPDSANPFKVFEDDLFLEQSRAFADQLFTPYFDEQQKLLTEGYDTKQKIESGNTLETFAQRNTLDSSFANTQLAFNDTMLNKQLTEDIKKLEDQRQLAVDQEVQKQIIQEQAIRTYLLDNIKTETLPPEDTRALDEILNKNINTEQKIKELGLKINELGLKYGQELFKNFQPPAKGTNQQTSIEPIPNNGTGIPPSNTANLQGAKLEDYEYFNNILNEANSNPIAQKIYNYFAPKIGDREAKKMVILAKGESGWNPNAGVDNAGERSFGLFQINLDAHNDKVAKYTGTTDIATNSNWLKNPENNMIIAQEIYNQSGLAPWTYAHAGINTYMGVVGNKTANLYDLK